MASTTTTRSGQVNLVAPCSANQRWHSVEVEGLVGLDHGDDPLAEAVVGLADDDGVADRGVGLEGGFDRRDARRSRRRG